MRGEHGNVHFVNVAGQGSSPHARGARIRAVTAAPASGIIPACAGSTLWPCWSCIKYEDHPRMRGEHSRSFHKRVKIKGSSPHARGALVPMLNTRRATGIIPACAGSTWLSPPSISMVEDHPRMRGEH